MPVLDERLVPVFEEVLSRNPGETEFHQAVREVLESMTPVVSKHPQYADSAVIRRMCEPERQIIFRVSWVTDAGAIEVNRGFAWSSTPPSAPSKACCDSTPAFTWAS